jgi:hypothetical protein
LILKSEIQKIINLPAKGKVVIIILHIDIIDYNNMGIVATQTDPITNKHCSYNLQI